MRMPGGPMRYFTEEQLAREIKPLPDVALEALEAGQIERLYHLLNEMSVGHKELDALGLQWISRMFGKIRSDIGEDFLDEVLAESASFLMAPYAEGFRNGDEKGTILEFVAVWKSSVSTNLVPLGEDDDQVILSLSPCGTGGRILLEGWPQLLPELFSPCSDGTPIYCRGCKALQQAFNRAVGETVWTTRISETLPGSCEMRFYKQRSKGRRLFDTDEFYRIGKTRPRQALDMLLAGNVEIGELIRNQHWEWLPWHDLFVQWATCILSAVYRKKGADYLDGFLKDTYDTAFSFLYQLYDALDDVGVFRLFARIWNYHMATFRVEEEEDRFVFILDPCGSGGRLYRSDMHKGQFRYGRGVPCLMENPANINFNRKDFPIYCVHCASSNRDQLEGGPLVFIIDGHAQKDPASPCVHYLYKKGAKREVPPAILAQVGKSEVAPLKRPA